MGLMDKLKPSSSPASHSSGPPSKGLMGMGGGGGGGGAAEPDSGDEEWDAQHTQYDASQDTSNVDDATAERELDKDMQWAGRPASGKKFAPLRRPIVVPQTAPGMVNLFQRAWAPDLAHHDVRPEEWMQFVDHLNICKTGTPPLQVLNLAGTVVGFVPVHYAQLAGMATNAVAVGGMIAVSKVRVTRYLKRANGEYFIPRGLIARIAKQNNIHEVTGQSPDAPMLAEPIGDDPSQWPDVTERRMQAFQGYIAPLQFEGVPEKVSEGSTLDRMTAKMNAMKENRGKKTDENGNDISKHKSKLDKSRQEAEEEAQEIRADAEKELRKKPEKRDKIEKDMKKELAKLQEDAEDDNDKYLKKSGKGGKKMERKVKKFMFIVVQNLDDYMRQQEQAQAAQQGGSGAAPGQGNSRIPH